jgi:hypothetical protein
VISIQNNIIRTALEKKEEQRLERIVWQFRNLKTIELNKWEINRSFYEWFNHIFPEIKFIRISVEYKTLFMSSKENILLMKSYFGQKVKYLNINPRVIQSIHLRLCDLPSLQSMDLSFIKSDSIQLYIEFIRRLPQCLRSLSLLIDFNEIMNWLMLWSTKEQKLWKNLDLQIKDIWWKWDIFLCLQ